MNIRFTHPRDPSNFNSLVFHDTSEGFGFFALMMQFKSWLFLLLVSAFEAMSLPSVSPCSWRMQEQGQHLSVPVLDIPEPKEEWKLSFRMDSYFDQEAYNPYPKESSLHPETFLKCMQWMREIQEIPQEFVIFLKPV